MRILGRLFLALLLCSAAAAPAQAWWSKDWPNRMKITARAGSDGANIAEPIGRTQVLVRLHSGNFDFSTVREDGFDLRFIAADDKTPLHFHLERFDSLADQVAIAWVDIPDLAPGTATAFYVYWGNDKAPDGQDVKGTYDPDTALVYHFTEANGLPKDSTGYANNALTPGSHDDAGLIGPDVKLAGTPIRLAKNASLAITAGQSMTWSMWVQPAPATQSSVLFSDREGSSGVTIGLDAGVPYLRIDGPGGGRVQASKALPAGGWHHVAATVSDKATLFVDGAVAGEARASLPAINGAPQIGGSEIAAEPHYTGQIDQLVISKTARPAGAIAIAAASEGPNANLLAFDGPEQSSSGGGGGYFGTIVKSVTIDAWVIIIILAFMFAVCVLVMITKAMYLNAQGSADKVFKREYAARLKAQHGDHVSALAEVAGLRSKTLRKSPLFRLCEVGFTELQERLDSGRLQPQSGLRPEMLASMRAVLETAQTHEVHRLNNFMVFLTIGISGGPFLGLLGTVVGVMITFAAIAQAGDVNVNAIAPGIAAALLATVAGLTVAIPALFGYNYLLLRIKGSSSDMNAFVNELVSRMGEPVMTAPPSRLAAE